MDRFCDVVFNRAFFIPIEEGNHVFGIPLANHQSKENGISIWQALAMDTCGNRVFLRRRIRFRVDPI